MKTIALLDQNDEQSESMAEWDGWQVKLKVPDAIARKIFLSLVHSALTNGTTVPTI